MGHLNSSVDSHHLKFSNEKNVQSLLNHFHVCHLFVLLSYHLSRIYFHFVLKAMKKLMCYCTPLNCSVSTFYLIELASTVVF